MAEKRKTKVLRTLVIAQNSKTFCPIKKCFLLMGSNIWEFSMRILRLIVSRTRMSFRLIAFRNKCFLREKMREEDNKKKNYEKRDLQTSDNKWCNCERLFFYKKCSWVALDAKITRRRLPRSSSLILLKSNSAKCKSLKSNEIFQVRYN